MKANSNTFEVNIKVLSWTLAWLYSYRLLSLGARPSEQNYDALRVQGAEEQYLRCNALKLLGIEGSG